MTIYVLRLVFVAIIITSCKFAQMRDIYGLPNLNNPISRLVRIWHMI